MLTGSEISIKHLDRTRAHELTYAPGIESVQKICAEIPLIELQKPKIKGTLSPVTGGWDLEALLRGIAKQSCVISGEPVSTKVFYKVFRNYRSINAPAGKDTALDQDFNEWEEPTPETLFLDEIILESLILALPEYPKLARYEAGDFLEWHDSTSIESHENPFKNLNERLFPEGKE